MFRLCSFLAFLKNLRFVWFGACFTATNLNILELMCKQTKNVDNVVAIGLDLRLGKNERKCGLYSHIILYLHALAHFIIFWLNEAQHKQQWANGIWTKVISIEMTMSLSCHSPFGMCHFCRVLQRRTKHHFIPTNTRKEHSAATRFNVQINKIIIVSSAASFSFSILIHFYPSHFPLSRSWFLMTILLICLFFD